MMAFDMGGPLNKTAYAFATTGLAAAATATDAPELKMMAAVMLAGMVPPIGPRPSPPSLRPEPVLDPRARERQGRLAMGASFITEGAIPFAAADPLRVIPVDHARQRGHRRPVARRSASASAPRTAASSCCSPWTTCSAS